MKDKPEMHTKTKLTQSTNVIT